MSKPLAMNMYTQNASGIWVPLQANPNGQATMQNSSPVVIASDQTTLPGGMYLWDYANQRWARWATNGSTIDGGGNVVQPTVPILLVDLSGLPYTPSNPLPVNDVGAAVTLLENSTTISAAASGSVTLAGAANVTTYIRGFKITSQAATAVVSGLVTITGLTTTLNFYYDNLVTGQSDLEVYFGEDGVKASAVNTSIVVNFPAITGGAATAISAWGYRA